jgi:hypothetical protein
MTIAYLDRSDGQTVSLEMRADGDNRRPFVAVAGRRHATMASLVADCPELGAHAQLPLYCALSVHLSRGPGYLLIADPDEFRSRYQALIAHRSADSPGPADFGPFDLAEIALPAVSADTLVFYAEDALYSVPYRVEVPWPANANRLVRFLLLPIQQ